MAASALSGFLLTLGDIKAIAFYASLFPSLVDVSSLLIRDIALIVLITTLTVGGVKAGYALLSPNILTRSDWYPWMSSFLFKGAGISLVLIGIYYVALNILAT